jgi:hypothetical protein
MPPRPSEYPWHLPRSRGRIHDLAAVVRINGEITVDARLIAPHLGPTPEEMMAELRCGLVYQVPEKGTAADDGSIRLTFRYRARECRIVVDASGSVVG